MFTVFLSTTSKLLLSLLFLLPFSSYAQYLNPQEEIPSIDLYDVTSRQNTSLDQYKDHKALVLIFISNNCPYSNLYIDRIKEISRKYAEQNVAFAMINSNPSGTNESESIENMRLHLKDNGLDITYFADKKQLAKRALKAEKNPEVFVLQPSENGFIKLYQGAIDDNPQSSNLVSNNYIKLSLDNLIMDRLPSLTYRRPIGCRIKDL